MSTLSADTVRRIEDAAAALMGSAWKTENILR